jgi:signal transduction histidine kinase
MKLLLGARYISIRRVVVMHTLITDAVLAVLVAVISTPWRITPDSSVRTWLLQSALLVPLVWRRRYPCGVFVVVSFVALIQWFVGIQLVADLSLLVALSTVATYRPRRFGLAAAGLLEIGALMASLRWSLAGSALRSLVFLSGLVAAGLLLGTNLRARRSLVASLTQRADRLERERDQQAIIAAAAERNRIAREMHDVIGHSLAVMVSLADGAAAKLTSDPERAATAIWNVSALGRQALGETRRVVGILRAGETTDSFAPQPDLARLDELVAQLRSTGLDATLHCVGNPAVLSTGIELAVFRIAQEAITNILKHATGVKVVMVGVVIGVGAVDLEVTDDGKAPEPYGVFANDLRRLRGTPSLHFPGGEGQGLIGMKERAAAYGGSITAGWSDRGWAVRAHLPTTGP